MAYKTCPSCGKEADACLLACPHCGADLLAQPEHVVPYSEYKASHLSPQDREIYERAYKGDGEAMCAYGRMRYVAPMGDEEAYEWYLCAARAGCGEGFYHAGCMWYFGDVMWEEQKNSLKEAMRYFRAGAKLGNARCMYMAGLQYLNGNGVKQDDARAFEYLTMAAEAGDKDGMLLSARHYLHGTHGFPHDPQQAKALYEKAGETHTMYRVFRDAYATGDGLPQDAEKAAEFGEKYLETLMRLYETVPQKKVNESYAWLIGEEYLGRGDEETAAVWFRKAMESGDVMGRIDLQRLNKL